MCCFSRSVQSVSNTQIFARNSTGIRQFLVYQMRLQAKENLAMILPLPVPKDPHDDAVRFISLKEYPAFFADMRRGFSVSRPAAPAGAIAKSEKKLAVVEVGDFEASFVPKVADFKRLDERFRLPDATWDGLPAYRDFGFAVFKLKPGGTDHPMAFEFPRALPQTLFFPTVHIHDGKVHETADFDHQLYCQPGDAVFASLIHWEESAKPANLFMDMKRSAGLLSSDDHCYLKKIQGRQKNTDVVLP